MSEIAPIFDPYAESGDNGAAHVFRVTPALLASPTSIMLNDKRTIWQRNTAPFDRWASDGVALNPLGANNGALQAFFEQQLSANGAVLNGTANDQPAIQAALNAIKTKNINIGLNVYMPDGVAGLGSQLQIPSRITVFGRGKRGPSSFKALSSFSQGSATDKSIIKLGLDGDTLAFDCGLKYTLVDASSVASSIAVSCNKLQEGSGLEHVALINWTLKGWYAANDNNANFFGHDIEAYGITGATAGIELNNVGGKVVLSSISVVGGNSGVPAGLTNGLTVNGGQVNIQGLHVESLVNGLRLIGNNVSGEYSTIGTSGTAGNVTNLVNADNLTHAKVRSVTLGGSTNALVDAFVGVTRQDAYLTEYGGIGWSGGLILNRNPTGGPAVGVNMTGGQYIPCNTLAAATTVSAPSNDIEGMSLDMFFTQDGTGGRTLTFNSIYKGVTLGSSGTANQTAWISFKRGPTNWYQTGTSGWVT